MSGFEVAGIVLGTIPLVISALEHYKSGRSTIATLVKYRSQVDRLIYQLKIQQTHFYFDILQLLRSAEIEEAEETDILPEDCLHILQNAKNGKQLQEYLGTHYDAFFDILYRYEKCLKKISKKLKHIKRLPDAAKDDLAALLAANPPVKGQFEFAERISFSIEKGSLATLVEELGEDRLNLKVIIKGMRTEKEFCAKTPSSESKRLSQMLAQVSASAKALYAAVCQTCACACQNHHRVFLELHNRMPQPSATRSRARGIESLIFKLVFEMGSHMREAYVKASMHDTTTIAGLPVRKQGRHVSFQDPNDPAPTIVLTGTDPSSTTTAKVLGICDLVSQSRARDCVLSLQLQGEILDLIQEPYQVQRDLSTPTTLDAVLRQGAAEKKLRLTPKQKNLLALDIASSVIQLRQTYWSHPALSSKVIKCILCAKGKNARFSTIAFIEQGVAKGQTAPSDSEPKVALLELVILLLEIWHHETIEMWAEESGFGNTVTSRERLAAAKEWLEATAEEMPVLYLEAAEQCLSLCVQRSRDWDDLEFVRIYCENVIKPLQKSCNTW